MNAPGDPSLMNPMSIAGSKHPATGQAEKESGRGVLHRRLAALAQTLCSARRRLTAQAGSAPLFKKAALGTAVAMAMTGASPAVAQSGGDTAPALAIELNTVNQVETSCRLIFMARNTLGRSLSAVSLETVLIDKAGIVDRLTVFDFQALPNERPRVRQFDLADTDCRSLGEILINGVATCEGDDVDPAFCADGLTVTSRSDVEISG